MQTTVWSPTKSTLLRISFELGASRVQGHLEDRVPQQHRRASAVSASSMESIVGSCYFLFTQMLRTLQTRTCTMWNTCFNECAALSTEGLQGLKCALTVRLHSFQNRYCSDSKGKSVLQTAYYMFHHVPIGVVKVDEVYEVASSTGHHRDGSKLVTGYQPAKMRL